MIINDNQAKARLESPMNLINRLKNLSGNKKNNAMSLFIPSKKQEEIYKIPITTPIVPNFNPFQPQASSQVLSVLPTEKPTQLSDILENSDSQIKLGLAHDKALELLNRSVEALSNKLDDVRADKLPSVISAASKTVESIRKERSEQSKNQKDREVHYHFYTPQQNKISDYEVIEVQGSSEGAQG